MFGGVWWLTLVLNSAKRGEQRVLKLTNERCPRCCKNELRVRVFERLSIRYRITIDADVALNPVEE